MGALRLDLHRGFGLLGVRVGVGPLRLNLGFGFTRQSLLSIRATALPQP